MSWGFRFAIPASARATGIENVRDYDRRVASAGSLVPYLKRQHGVPCWATARYGIKLSSAGRSRLFWNARRQALSTNESWARLLHQRIAIPIDAYVENRPLRGWQVGPAAWLPGLISVADDGGIVIITEPHGDGGSPILFTQAAAIAWLDAKPWDTLKMLDGARACYEEADIFVAASLDRERQTRVPLAA